MYLLHGENYVFGYVVTAQVMRWMKKRVKAIWDRPAPKFVAEVRSFHGLTNFYKRNVKDFIIIASPLT